MEDSYRLILNEVRLTDLSGGKQDRLMVEQVSAATMSSFWAITSVHANDSEPAFTWQLKLDMQHSHSYAGIECFTRPDDSQSQVSRLNHWGNKARSGLPVFCPCICPLITHKLL